MANRPARNPDRKPERKDNIIRRINQTVHFRSLLALLFFGVVTFLLVAGKLCQLQIGRHQELEQLAVEQQMRSTDVTANRGTIVDRNGNVLAISATAETVFLSPLELEEELAKEDTKWTADFLAKNLAEILDINAEGILQKMERTESQYEVLRSRVEEKTANKVRKFIEENEIRGIYMNPDAKRYYPYGSLASHVVGFVGDDNTGLYGLEAQYDDELQGQTGLVITAHDNAGNDMPYEYEKYYAAHNGSNLMLTLDTTVQYYLEKGLEYMVDQFDASQGASGVVLDVKTGAILGMASYPNYDLNDFTQVQDRHLRDLIASGQASVSEMQLRQWRNKALNDTYEPGSTFKILTLAAALEEGVVDENTTFNCTGATHVSGATIHCSGLHGFQTLEETAANSCNPAFISYGLGIGQEKFYEYMRNFGLMDGSGVDLAGEAEGIFIAEKNFTTLDLACYAFGQNFNVTPIALAAAQAACINGGYLRQPYVVDQILGDDGTVLFQHDNTPIRQVVSETTSQEVRKCLEAVVRDGSGRNGQVAGYRIGGKTGTADKGQTGEVVVSFASFAPADDPEVLMLLALDTPSRSTKTYPSGGAMVAPTASTIMSEILPYLGIEPVYSAEELQDVDTTVPNLKGLSVDEATERLKGRGFTFRVVGKGSEITNQTPAGGAVIPGKSTVVLYAGAKKPTAKSIVPALVGKTAAEANVAATNAGLFLRFTGTTAKASDTIRVLGQSEDVGAKVSAGTVIEVQLGDTSVTD